MDLGISSPVRNPDFTRFRSPSGSDLLPIADFFEGCPSARALGSPTSVAAVYRRLPNCLPPPGARMSQMGAWLPYLRWLGLGEGGTPLLELSRAGSLARLSLKAEWM